MSINPLITFEPFYKWEVYFFGPTTHFVRHTGTHYIITMTKYLTIWVEVVLIKNCFANTGTWFLF